MNARRAQALGTAVLLSLAALALAQAPEVVRSDLYIGHVSTVPVTAGERVRLFARRYRTEGADLGAVIVLSSDALPSDAGLGLDLPGYNHLERLAGLGFDVFAADLTGYGRSPMPMMGDGCNAPGPIQTRLLTPYPLYIPCETSYPRPLTSLFSDWDEVASIVAHVRDLTGDDRVVLMGWGAGGARAAGYAARNPDEVERLVLLAPRYDPTTPAEPPTVAPPGFPLDVHAVDELVETWRASVRCEGWADFDGVAAQLRREVNEFDPVAAQWGYDLGNLFRSPGRLGAVGFGQDLAERIRTPTLVVRGLDDPHAAEALTFFEDLATDDKLRLDVECGSHRLIWEATRDRIADALAEFLQSGTVDGRARGGLTIDRAGTVR